MATLKDRISSAEHDALSEESPIAALFRPKVETTTEVDAPLAVGKQDELRELPVDALDEMEQPFRLYSDEAMEDMRQSIVAHGIIQRIIVRPSPDTPGRWQIISGRNRRRAAKLAGYTMVPCEIRNLTDDEAKLQMVETNLRQREELLPSEKAWAYRIRLEALVHQGKRTSPQIAAKLRSDDAIGGESGKSGDTIHRYIRLTYLIQDLLDAVDDKTLGLSAGYDLSFLCLEDQESVYQYFFVNNKFVNNKKSISGALSKILREKGETVPLTVERIQAILAPSPAPIKLKKVSVPMKPLRKFFPAEATQKEIEEKIVEIVTAYFSGQKQEEGSCD